MALPATEAFTGTGALSASWTQQESTANVERNTDQAAPSANNSASARWNADTFNNDQYSKWVIKARTSGSAYVNVMVRSSGSVGAMTCYQYFTDGASGSGHTEVIKFVGGGGTSLGAVATTYAVNDTIELSITGSTLSCKKTGTTITTFSDAAIASGAAAISMYGAAARADDWEGGNVGGGGTTFTDSRTESLDRGRDRDGHGGFHRRARRNLSPRPRLKPRR
jgi:hypothetical protein